MDSITAILQYSFKDPEILNKALTHGSAAADPSANYERLEFLGDRILSLVVAEMLYEQFPDENEGKLACRSADLVRRETLAEVTRKIGLSDHIIMSMGEAGSGGRANPSLLADVCESVIAALYLDGGHTVAETFIIVVSVADGPESAGTGSTRRAAEQSAAGALLKMVQADD